MAKVLSIQKTVDCYSGLTGFQRQRLYWFERLIYLDTLPTRILSEEEFRSGVTLPKRSKQRGK